MKRNIRSGSRLPQLSYFFILLSVLYFFHFSPLISEAAFKVYLKNGMVMTAVDGVKKEAGKVTIYKYGIKLEMPESSIIAVEEDRDRTFDEDVEEIEAPAEEGLPGYVGYDENAFYRKQRAEEQEKSRRLNQAKRKYLSVLNTLERLDELEKRSRELQWESRKKWSPRKARIARKEKAEIDKELEKLRMEKDSLLNQKEELESQIDILER